LIILRFETLYYHIFFGNAFIKVIKKNKDGTIKLSNSNVFRPAACIQFEYVRCIRIHLFILRYTGIGH